MVKSSEDEEFENGEPERFESFNDSENDTSDFMKGMEEAEEPGAARWDDEDEEDEFGREFGDTLDDEF